jgi:hypothetical protein
VYRTLKFQGADKRKNKEYIAALGNVCSEIRQLPTSAIRSGVLEDTSGPSGSGGLTEAGKGKLGGVRVIIKTISVDGTDISKDPKKVRLCSLF